VRPGYGNRAPAPPRLAMGVLTSSAHKERDPSVGTPLANDAPDLMRTNAGRMSQLAAPPETPPPRANNASQKQVITKQAASPTVINSPSMSSKDTMETLPSLTASNSSASTASSVQILPPPPRMSSDDTVASSQGPISPRDGQPIPSLDSANQFSSPSKRLSPIPQTPSPPKRAATRAWDPARGVEVFKRSSEEVLARFLRMGSWESQSQQASPLV